MRLGDRDDSARESHAVGADPLTILSVGSSTTFAGEAGNDTLSAEYGSGLEGGDGADLLEGASGITGGRGNDSMIAGPLGTEFDEDSPGNGSDVIRGGRGDDLVTYRGRRRGVRLDLAGDRDDGEPGERDQIGANVEQLAGGHGDDWLTGNAADNFLVGESGTDMLRGGAGDDELRAAPTGDDARVERTADRLYGGPGDDSLGGSDGRNLLSPGPGQDGVSGGAGDDTVRARDRSVDDVECGAGRDRARIDRLDLAKGCERSRRSRPAGAIPYETFSLKGGLLYVNVACPADGPPICRGTASVLLRGASTGPARRFRVRRGKVGFLFFGRRPQLFGKTVVAEVRSADRNGRLSIVRRREYLEPQ